MALAAFGLAFGSPLSGIVSADEVEPLYDLIDTATQRLATADPVAASKWLNG